MQRGSGGVNRCNIITSPRHEISSANISLRYSHSHVWKYIRNIKGKSNMWILYLVYILSSLIYSFFGVFDSLIWSKSLETSCSWRGRLYLRAEWLKNCHVNCKIRIQITLTVWKVLLRITLKSEVLSMLPNNPDRVPVLMPRYQPLNIQMNVSIVSLLTNWHLLVYKLWTIKAHTGRKVGHHNIATSTSLILLQYTIAYV